MEEKEEEEVEEEEENFRIPKEAAKLVVSFGLEVGTFILQFLHLHTACMHVQCEEVVDSFMKAFSCNFVFVKDVREASFLRSLLHLFYLFGFDRRLIILRKRVFLVVVLEESLTFVFVSWGGGGETKGKNQCWAVLVLS
jgi:hypothetical protein